MVLALCLWAAIPITSVVVLDRKMHDTTFAQPRATWVTVRPSNGQRTENIGLALRWSPPTQLLAPAGWQGVVGAVHVHAGDVVSTGDPLLTLNGVRRLAVRSPQPFYRPLRPGDTGPDVAWLNDALSRMRLDHDRGSRFTERTSAGVDRLATAVGARVGRRGTFDPAWLVYLPTEKFEIHGVDLAVGGPPPAPGEPFASGPQTLDGALLVPADFSEGVPDGGATASSNPQTPDASELISAKPSQQLQVATTTLRLNADRTSVPAAQLRKISPAPRPADRIVAASLVSDDPAGWLVPATAVFTSRGLTQCIVLRTHGEIRGVRVSIIQSDDGRTVVAGSGISDGEDVLVAPPAQLRQCA